MGKFSCRFSGVIGIFEFCFWGRVRSGCSSGLRVTLVFIWLGFSFFFVVVLEVLVREFRGDFRAVGREF